MGDHLPARPSAPPLHRQHHCTSPYDNDVITSCYRAHLTGFNDAKITKIGTVRIEL